MPLAAVAVALLPAYPPSLSLCYRHLIPGNVDLLPSIAATGGCGRVLKTSIRHTAGILPLPLISSLLLSCRRLLRGLLLSLSLCYRRFMPVLSVSCRPSLLPTALAPLHKTSIRHAADMLSLILAAVAVALLPTLLVGDGCALLP
ncbi:hypothetical protein PF005_g15810 [Phytophthora fragariae]|uniref:Uncharacterized protein n=1 Tax=Phytophthora fragariae TaxID=53985 RepID=A0A6A3ZF64_9STRA|nr:hypothetical protein PF009_g17323 [Phytophthora fragariae]KAE8999029.1 hypothetical protein PF011_g14797 [Phytophthora fragariae]KAE9075082.1 hypothetical protein PF010_g24446 [Phytophthora fragariae]KAE9096578.1 hypothetical protein PF007_g16947 [Phytophthora fragariae]KAE9134835.1 hypothetical protein PF006_g14740 [Phytophthora fragariae]